jgi:hypothetical protein
MKLHVNSGPLVALVRAFVREESRVVLLLLGSGGLILAMHLLTAPSATRWSGRTVNEWLPVLTSRRPESRDSALVAISTLEPDAARTIRIAAEMLSDADDYVAQSAMDALILRGRAGGRALPVVLDRTTSALHAKSAIGRVRAARVLGAIGGLASRAV